MEEFKERPLASKPTYDFAMPQNADYYGNSQIIEADGRTHMQVTHSKVRVWAATNPDNKTSVTIVSGNGARADAFEIGPGALEYIVPLSGLVSVVSDDGVTPLFCFADIFPVWAG